MGSIDHTRLPEALILGAVHHATDVLDRLQRAYTVHVLASGVTRASFFADCAAGRYDNVVAIGRSVDSVALTGRFDPELVHRLPPSVRFVCHNGAGYDQVDVAACRARGIAVSNTPDVVNAATADTTLLLLLAALRRARIPQAAVLEGQWTQPGFRLPLGRDPAGLTLGIVGLGGIGAAVAQRAAAFGMQVQYHNRRPAADAFLNDKGVRATYVTTLAQLLRTSDVVSVHVPLSDATHHLIGAAEFAQMKAGVVFVNTARGPVVDEAALVDALESGHVWSAGLDVFENEPHVHPGLLRNENTVLLPHIGTATKETRRAMEALMLENVESGLARGHLKTPVLECRETESS
ncbi:hypothetical protein HMPREF1624_01583 [Sporothrix schenckii ATCC 58251]|uniref:Phosphoglycerate dehydrogenase n=1 Tax=Sporothrix schenckii (strain ATCC 58251 / de Perez 2211183) TaxID=1391915 RepID=U7Q7T0_SPOS1|nr:hypothetical protein HMPREF1624_01583 [Sporothrix schenckii ATCC 58251]